VVPTAGDASVPSPSSPTFHWEVFWKALIWPVILSAAKDLSPGTEILSAAKDDSLLVPFLKNLRVKAPPNPRPY